MAILARVMKSCKGVYTEWLRYLCIRCSTGAFYQDYLLTLEHVYAHCILVYNHIKCIWWTNIVVVCKLPRALLRLHCVFLHILLLTEGSQFNAHNVCLFWYYIQAIFFWMSLFLWIVNAWLDNWNIRYQMAFTYDGSKYVRHLNLRRNLIDVIAMTVTCINTIFNIQQ